VLEFSVSDTGIGVAADKIDLLFKPFSQADSSTTREYGGSGLGLSIVLSLAKAMEGEAGVESAPGKGSRFWFRVKARLAAAQDEAHTADSPTPAENGPQFRGRVVVVEDNSINRMVVESLLERLGIAAVLVHDGQQAVDYVANCAPHALPDLLLMDLQMPVMDGFTATQHIRQWEERNGKPRLPIIALTADAYAEDRQRCLTMGMDDFLTKPIAIGALRQTLARWLPKA